MENKEIRKVQGLIGEHSFTIVLPKKYANNLGITKGDWVSIIQEHEALIIRKLWDTLDKVPAIPE